eukprot:COSAG05_NODE_1436_length_4889_cov_42.859290_1_plen_29_part_10
MVACRSLPVQVLVRLAATIYIDLGEDVCK